MISIIINNHNYGRFLAAAIESALTQSYEQVEVIVVDDGSSDDSPEVIRRYEGRLLAVWQEHQGQAAAINSGFRHASGDVVIFLDADDVLRSETAGRVARAFRQTPSLVKLMYPLEVIDAASRSTGEIRPSAHLPLSTGNLQQQLLSFPFDLTWVSTSGNAFAASVLDRILPMPHAEYPILADYYLSLVTPLFGPVGALESPGGYYRLHGSNYHQNGQGAINLPQIRQVLNYAATTAHYIDHYATGLQLLESERAHEEVLSVSLIGQRLISLKFDPAAHPFPEDTVWSLLRLGALAAQRRFDVRWPMRLLYLTWFGAMAAAPPAAARWLADRFLAPDKRRRLNPVLRSMRKPV